MISLLSISKSRQKQAKKVTEQTRQSVAAWITKACRAADPYFFPTRIGKSPYLSTRRYARIVACWVASIGLDASAYGTHTMQPPKATRIYQRTNSLRAGHLLLGHTKRESLVRNFGMG